MIPQPIIDEVRLRSLPRSDVYRVMDRELAWARTCEATNDRDGVDDAERRLDLYWSELDRRTARAAAREARRQARMEAEAARRYAAHGGESGR